MKLIRKYWFAWVVAILVAVGSVSFGVLTADADLLPVKEGKWVSDGADVLNEETEQAIQNYNTSFDRDFNAYVAVATVNNMKGWKPDEYAAKLFNKWGLYGNDFLLLLDAGGKQSYLYHGSNYTDFDYSAYLDGFVNPSFAVGDYDAAVTELLPGIQSYLEQLHGTEGMSDSTLPEGSDTGDAPANPGSDGKAEQLGEESKSEANKENKKGFKTWIFAGLFVLLLAVLFVFLEALDRSRYRSWHRRYGREEEPRVMFRPIFFWHRPGSRWCQACVGSQDRGRRSSVHRRS